MWAAAIRVRTGEVAGLGVQDGAGPEDAEPGDGGACREPVVPDEEERGQGAGATEAGVAVDGDEARGGIDDAKELGGGGAVGKGAGHVDPVAGDAGRAEGRGIVVGALEGYYIPDAHVAEYFSKVLRAEATVAFVVTERMASR